MLPVKQQQLNGGYPAVMESSLILLLVLSLFLGTACWLLFLWAVRRRQFDDAERPKYRMLDDEE